jgi:hypothetical protein|tara:strand:- start:2045 stop:3559 length:1515 start_codon:yes stop_codon:yes gene_type:complete
MALSTYIVEVDWIGDGAFTGTSDDVTANVNTAQWKRGRDYASQLVGRSRSAVAAIRLNDVDGTYMSFNVSSDISGSTVPGREVRITQDGTVIWHGYLKTLIPAPAVRGVNQVTLQAQGAIGHIGHRKINVPMLENVTTTTALGTVLAQAGFPAADYSTGVALSTLLRYWAGNEPVTEAIRQIEATEGGFVYETKAKGIHFEGRQDRQTSPFTTSQATFTDSATGTLTYTRIQQADPSRFIYNDLEVAVAGYRSGTGTILWEHPEAGTTDSPSLGAGETFTIWANHPTPTSLPETIGVLEWITPTAGVHYVANSSTGGTGTNLTNALTLAVDKFGDRMKMTFENTGTARAFFTTLEASGSALLQRDPVIVSTEDTTSQVTYGERSYRNPSRFISNASEANDWANYYVSFYKDAVPIISIAYNSHKDGSHAVQSRTRDISDRITVVATGSAGLGLIDEDFTIEAEWHSINRVREHEVRYDLSPVNSFSGFWVLNVSKLGTSTRLSY